MSKDITLAWIAVARAMLDMMETTALSGEPIPVEMPCDHPDEQRTDGASFGNPHAFFCKQCMKLINPDAPMGKE